MNARSEDGKTTLVIGGTGSFGGLISRSLRERGANLRLLVRPASVAKLAPDLADRAELFTSEAGAFEGVHTVISAVQGGPDTIIDSQLSYLRAARSAGVKRFIPSDFSFNLFNLSEGDNINSDWRRAFARAADAERGDMALVHVMIGCFLDVRVLYGFLGAFDLTKNEAYLWGEGDAKMQFTTYRDAAAYVAEAALAEGPTPSQICVAGDSLTFHELVAETSAGLGRPIAIKPLGALSDLDDEIARRRRAEPANMFAWLPLMYWRAMLNGKGALGPLQNDKFPTIHPTSVRRYAEGLRT